VEKLIGWFVVVILIWIGCRSLDQSGFDSLDWNYMGLDWSFWLECGVLSAGFLESEMWDLGCMGENIFCTI